MRVHTIAEVMRARLALVFCAWLECDLQHSCSFKLSRCVVAGLSLWCEQYLRSACSGSTTDCFFELLVMDRLEDCWRCSRCVVHTALSELLIADRSVITGVARLLQLQFPGSALPIVYLVPLGQVAVNCCLLIVMRFVFCQLDFVIRDMAHQSEWADSIPDRHDTSEPRAVRNSSADLMPAGLCS